MGDEYQDSSADAADGIRQPVNSVKDSESTIREAKPSLMERLRNRFPFLGTKKGIALVILIVILVIGGGLSGLAALHRGGDSNGGDDEPVSEDTHFYGQSPAVYPSPEMEGHGGWSDASDKAKKMVDNMTLEEKVSLTGGVGASNGCAGNLPPVDSVGFPGMCLHDAGQGVRNTDFVNSYPAGIHVGASWNKNLTLARARDMGAEFRRKGVNVLLGPSIGPMGRVVRGGRNWESFSVDPYLTGALVHETVRGVQESDVIASTKHFIANEQETFRMQKLPREAVSSNIDDRTMHELYLWPFADAVKAGTGNIMCSYQRINNSYGCQNSKAMNGLLKEELGFQGWVVSDWDAQHAGVDAALAGMDVAMPVPHDYWGGKLVDAVRNGSVPESRVTDMVVRILASWYRMSQDNGDDEDGFPDPGVGMPQDVREPHRIVDARNTSSRQVLLDGAVEGHVLVKNVNSTLPLDQPRLLSLFGYSAKAPDEFNTNGGGFSDSLQFGAQPVTPGEIEAGFTMDDAYEGFPGWSAIGANGTLISGGGSGATAPSTFIAPLEALKARADEDGTALLWDLSSDDPNPGVHPASDACLVFGNAWASESYDRPGLRDDFTDDLISHVAERCRNTVVILHNAGPRLVDPWINNPNVTAVIFAHLPGQVSGKALSSILYGDENPSGKLPYTVARNESGYGGVQDPDVPDGRRYENYPQSDFNEGVYLDYRHFDREDIEPRFEFGFGLSYTTFEYRNLTIDFDMPDSSDGRNSSSPTPTSSSASSTLFAAAFPTRSIREGGPVDLWDGLVRVSADVTNVGPVDGAEVAQLYVGIPEPHSPKRQLRGFEKPYMEAGEVARVEFVLTRRDLSFWDVQGQRWRLPEGEFGVWVGGSSRDLPLVGNFTVSN